MAELGESEPILRVAILKLAAEVVGVSRDLREDRRAAVAGVTPAEDDDRRKEVERRRGLWETRGRELEHAAGHLCTVADRRTLRRANVVVDLSGDGL